MGTGEKRCNDCGWEFYEGVIDEVEQEDGSFKDQELCPECFSPDWEYKLIGMGD